MSNGLIFEGLSGLYLEDRTADVYFKFVKENPPERVAAHKNLLANASSVFKQMFYGRSREENDVEISDASSAGFKCFLKFFYLMHLDYSPENISEIMYLADKYIVSKCKISCEKYLINLISVHPKYDFMSFELALQYDCSKLYWKCRECIKGNKIQF